MKNGEWKREFVSLNEWNYFFFYVYIGSIAQEVLSFKSGKGGDLNLNIPQPQQYGSSLRRKESMSAQDRETLERSKQAASQSRSRSESMSQDNSVAATAVANHSNIQDMEVEELERELSGNT